MASFSALLPGESFILVNDHEPKPLLYQFQAELDGRFEWWPLEQGPEVWRIQVAKRVTPEPKRTVTELLQTDHRRLDAIYERFEKAVKEDRWDEASRDFKEFATGLKRHIRSEEEILFPVFEEKTGMVDAGPTAVMRMEHTDIKALLDKIVAATDGKEAAEVKDSANALTLILADHNMKEEHILYPESDSFLNDSERSDVVKKAQAT
jgi:uncharacterized protein (DUF2249 family)/iron-sulfur cluster repair protein YtfE (RIC family)